MNFALDIIMRSTIILLLAALLSWVLRRASASTRHAVWAIALISSLVLPLASLTFPPLNVVAVQEPAVRMPIAPSATEVSKSVSDATVPPLPQTPPTPLPDKKVRRWLQPEYAVGIWLFGTVLVAMQLLLGLMSVRRLLMRSTIAPSDWQVLLNELKAGFYILKSVQLVIGKHELAPMTSGLRSNVIILPSQATGWTEECRRYVLIHELAHVKRQDGLIQILVQIICAIYWFNPIVWYASRRLQLEREHACDDRVLNAGANADDYASHLLKVARAVHPRGLANASLSMASPSHLEWRLRAIVDDRRKRQSISSLAVALLIGFSALLTVTLATVRLTALPLPMMLHPLMRQPVTEAPYLRSHLSARLTQPPAQDPLAGTFVKIAPGEFMMGCGRGEMCGVVDSHPVRITRGFEIGRYEVTQAQWESVMNTNPSDFKGADLPVEQVSWNEAQEFLRRLDGKRDGYHYRLPTEAEWEYAARAGQPVRWVSGPSVPPIVVGSWPLDEIAWTGRNSGGQTHPVGQKKANAWGLYDTQGNVSELTQDWYSDDYFATSPRNDPQGPDSGFGRVVRGQPSWEIQVGARLRYDIGANVKYDFIGFRIVREPLAAAKDAIRR